MFSNRVHIEEINLKDVQINSEIVANYVSLFSRN